MATVSDSEEQVTGGQAASSASSRGDRQAIVVVDDLPGDIPIAVRELEAIETYVADLVDQIFGEAAAGPDNSGG